MFIGCTLWAYGPLLHLFHIDVSLFLASEARSPFKRIWYASAIYWIIEVRNTKTKTLNGILCWPFNQVALWLYNDGLLFISSEADVFVLISLPFTLLPIENVGRIFHWMWSWEHFSVLQLRSSAQINFGYVSEIECKKIAHENKAKNTFFINSHVIDEQTKLNSKTFFLRRNSLLVYEYDAFPSVLEFLSSERKLKSILRLSVFFAYKCAQIFLKEEICVFVLLASV